MKEELLYIVDWLSNRTGVETYVIGSVILDAIVLICLSRAARKRNFLEQRCFIIREVKISCYHVTIQWLEPYCWYYLGMDFPSSDKKRQEELQGLLAMARYDTEDFDERTFRETIEKIGYRHPIFKRIS